VLDIVDHGLLVSNIKERFDANMLHEQQSAVLEKASKKLVFCLLLTQNWWSFSERNKLMI